MPDSGVTAVVDGSVEGLLTAIHMYYHANLRPNNLVDGSKAFQQDILANYLFVKTDYDLAGKVYAAMENKLRRETLERFALATSNSEPDKFYDIFRYILLAFKDPKTVDARLQLDFVMNVQGLARAVGREAHKLNGFVRFRTVVFNDSDQNILFAEISPKHYVLPIVCSHFTDRLISEPFVIYDCIRHMAGIYDTKELSIAELPKDVKPAPKETDDERAWQELWRTFYNALAIKERTNTKLRRNLSPKYYWKHMTEHLL